MVEIYNLQELNDQLSPIRDKGLKIGFVPTMGALHDGHISLINKAKKECDFVVVSIFVNPTQFNNSKDLEQYPRTEKEDIKLLRKNECDFVFLPSVSEMYPENYVAEKVDLHHIENTMEGAHRPGHFDGVVNIVSRFFRMVQPTKAFFGRKDFQQVAVVIEMVKQLKIQVDIVVVDTKRNASGLAMSSRNLRLSEQELEQAVVISQVLNKGQAWAKTYSPVITLEKMKRYFEDSALKLEYLQIVHPETLNDLNQYWVPGATACIAAFCGDVRLIDNMELVSTEEN
ncbi:pantoate--beta-alanine ligase [Brumimicrobium mesophilum]|uniref:pantoate--beta-alanine ligase n=1 Tax=Brumimicrobium mesophilum TaxID=392717 RepID=UPI00131EA812|nr:pantoate--beta-alanine ligase [Brumimicrobium mesophilum]